MHMRGLTCTNTAVTVKVMSCTSIILPYLVILLPELLPLPGPTYAYAYSKYIPICRKSTSAVLAMLVALGLQQHLRSGMSFTSTLPHRLVQIAMVMFMTAFGDVSMSMSMSFVSPFGGSGSIDSHPASCSSSDAHREACLLMVASWVNIMNGIYFYEKAAKKAFMSRESCCLLG